MLGGSIILYSMLLFTWSLCAYNQNVTTYYNIRSQGANSARKVAGTVPGSRYEHLYEYRPWYHHVSITPAYTKTFRPGAIAQSLFGELITPLTINNGCVRECDDYTILIQGTAVPNRLSYAMRADDLYLPDTFSSILTLYPRISNTIIDLNWYIGADQLLTGLYTRLYTSLVNTHWSLHMRERVKGGANGTMIAGSFASVTLANNYLLPTATSYFSGCTPPSLSMNANPDQPYTVQREPLKNTKVASKNCSHTAPCFIPEYADTTHTGCTELRSETGWNFLQSDCSHWGINVQWAIPVGNKADGDFLFLPRVGNGRHAELGVGTTAHWILYKYNNETPLFGIFLDATISHLFANTQQRTFDLVQKPCSRYMLAVEHIPVTSSLVLGQQNPSLINDQPVNASPSAFQIIPHYTPVANLTTQKVRVSYPVQADISIWTSYQAKELSWDIGYNVFTQSQEHISLTSCLPLLAKQPYWALKGDAHTYGFTPLDSNFFPNTAYALAIAQPSATIQQPATNNNQNVSTINSAYAVAQTEPNSFVMLLANQNSPVNPEFTTRLSQPPTFLTTRDINYNQRSRITLHSIFAHVNYGFEHYTTEWYIGMGAQVEFGIKPYQGCSFYHSCTENTVKSIGTSAWSAWLKIGVRT